MKFAREQIQDLKKRLKEYASQSDRSISTVRLFLHEILFQEVALKGETGFAETTSALGDLNLNLEDHQSVIESLACNTANHFHAIAYGGSTSDQLLSLVSFVVHDLRVDLNHKCFDRSLYDLFTLDLNPDTAYIPEGRDEDEFLQEARRVNESVSNFRKDSPSMGPATETVEGNYGSLFEAYHLLENSSYCVHEAYKYENCTDDELEAYLGRHRSGLREALRANPQDIGDTRLFIIQEGQCRYHLTLRALDSGHVECSGELQGVMREQAAPRVPSQPIRQQDVAH